ncbi:MAG: hypothetical protein ACE5GO_11925 [Anaerolineales bacterium]
MGVHVRDWNDQSVETFKKKLLDAKERLERELFELTEEDAAIELHVSLPDEGEHS